MISVRRFALFAVLTLTAGLAPVDLFASPANAAVAPPAGQLNLGAPDSALPAQVPAAAGAAQTQLFVIRTAPAAQQVLVESKGQTHRYDGASLTQGVSVADDAWALPRSSGGGAVPDSVEIATNSSDGTVALAPADQLLGAAGTAQVLIADAVPAGTALSLRGVAIADVPVGTLPAGTIGALAADATGAVFAFTPAGAGAPDIDYLDFATGTVRPVSTTAVSSGAALVALSASALAWTDGADVVRVPRAGGPEVRRTVGPTTALAVLNESTAWISGGHLLTALTDTGAVPLDHGAVLEPGVLITSNLAGYQVITGSTRAYATPFNATQVAAVGGVLDLGPRRAVLTDVRLSAGAVVRHDTSNPSGTITAFTDSNGALSPTNTPFFVSAEGGRRLFAASGRYRALGSADDTSVTFSASYTDDDPGLGAPKTIPVTPGPDTIELSGMRLLVHRPGSAISNLYTLGQSQVGTFPLDAALFGSRIAWQNADGAVQTQDLTSTAGVQTVRPAGAPAGCVSSCTLAATVRVAGNSVFWSWYGENRVVELAPATTLVLPDGDMTNARLGTGTLAVVDSANHVLTVTNLLDPALPSYQIADAPITFDVDERYVTWGDAGYAVHLARLPFDNHVPPQLLARWGADSLVVPASLSPTQTAVRWHLHADFTQPGDAEFRVDPVVHSLGFGSPGGVLAGTADPFWTGQTDGDSASDPGLYSWKLVFHSTVSATINEDATGILQVRDARPTSTVITAHPAALKFGSAGTIAVHLTALGAGLAAVPVVIQSRPHGTAVWHNVVTKMTGTGSAAGYATAVVAPTANSDYRAVYAAGTYGPSGSASTAAVTLVAMRVTARLSATRVPTGSAVALTGAVAPTRASQYVTVQRYYSGAWHTIASTRLTATSTYRYTIKTQRGTFSYRVLKAADSHNTAGTSPSATLSGV